ncbi:NAD(P)/FAD-dependent oxidoreductase [Alteromonas confluentis]|uniref:Amino acid dehydrogenase n=1 Tax=Alteromonas confluentis TaxID=1656094 RepID=A0A1E7Z5K3_9ALTE|nr:FAD-binding oxidoreductase [Alteromonas confluentis]OFC68833.1 amino acid dehydrogenase [Alteromonas confluentis]
MQYDTIVLGAGIVGVSAALHLQSRGHQVVLLDREQPGEGTSFGNAGLIERSSVIPYAFPREFAALLRYSLNRETAVRLNPGYLPEIAPWLFQYWKQSAPSPLDASTLAMLPLIERCTDEHDALVQQAGLSELIRCEGWIEIFKNERAFNRARSEAQSLVSYGINYDVLDQPALQQRDPHLSNKVIGGIHWLDPKTVTNPGALVKGYAALFRQRGGIILQGDARSVAQGESGWQVDTLEGPVISQNVVVALGPKSADIFKLFGYAIPLAVKRGYHRHFRMQEGKQLRHSVCDSESGFVLAPMKQGIRLSTGIEFDRPGAPKNDSQLRRCEAIARSLLPLGEPIEDEPWMGLRPCLPDMRPVIGAAPRHKGLWFNFGHAHHGLTLGPVTGRLLAEIMTGETPFTDPEPYSATRFSKANAASSQTEATLSS